MIPIPRKIMRIAIGRRVEAACIVAAHAKINPKIIRKAEAR